MELDGMPCVFLNSCFAVFHAGKWDRANEMDAILSKHPL